MGVPNHVDLFVETIDEGVSEKKSPGLVRCKAAERVPLGALLCALWGSGDGHRALTLGFPLEKWFWECRWLVMQVGLMSTVLTWSVKALEPSSSVRKLQGWMRRLNEVNSWKLQAFLHNKRYNLWSQYKGFRLLVQLLDQNQEVQCLQNGSSCHVSAECTPKWSHRPRKTCAATVNGKGLGNTEHLGNSLFSKEIESTCNYRLSVWNFIVHSKRVLSSAVMAHPKRSHFMQKTRYIISPSTTHSH